MEFAVITKPELNSHISVCLKNELDSFKKELIDALQTEKNFTIKEAAEYLNVSNITVHNYIKKGLFPTSKIGRRIIIKKSDLDLALKEVKSLKYKR